jgi:hypothetical protein
VVAAEFVGRGDGLLEREGRVGRTVHAEGGGAACGEDGGRCRGEGEDLCWVGCWSVVVSEDWFEKRNGMAGSVCVPSSTVWAVRYCFDCDIVSYIASWKSSWDCRTIVTFPCKEIRNVGCGLLQNVECRKVDASCGCSVPDSCSNGGVVASLQTSEAPLQLCWFEKAKQQQRKCASGLQVGGYFIYFLLLALNGPLQCVYRPVQASGSIHAFHRTTVAPKSSNVTVYVHQISPVPV